MKKVITNKTAYAYIRAAECENNLHLNAICDQRLAIEEYCKKNHIKIMGVSIDAPSSASDPNRKSFVWMLGRLILKPVDCIVVCGLDRLTRNTSEYSNLSTQLFKLNVEIISISGASPRDNCMEEILTLVDSLQPRLKAAKRAASKER